MFDLVVSLVILAAVFLTIGAYSLFRRGIRKQAGLMALLALIMIGNVIIWLLPTDSGESLADVATADGE